MILEIDAGNTFVKWRICSDGQQIEGGRFLTQEKCWPSCWRDGISEVRISSVAGEEVNAEIARAVESMVGLPGCFAQTTATCAGVTNSYSEPSRMGVDRWLAMLAAYNDCKGACCVVDCGSAITIDYINGAGEHEGGFIVPGLRLMQKGLLSNTAEIEVTTNASRFDLTPGVHTSAAVIHGINYLFTALAEKVQEDNEAKGRDYKLYVTGGDGQLFCSAVDSGEYVADLVMDGLSWGVQSK